MAIAFVDVDGTLVGGRTSSEVRFIRYLLQSRMLGPQQLAAALAFFPRWFNDFGRDTGKKNKAYLAGLDANAVAAAAEHFVREDLAGCLRPAMVARIGEHHRCGDTVALLTGTPDFIAAPLAGLAGADFWCATKCVRKDGVFAGAPPPVHPFAGSKLDLAQAICAERGVALNTCAAYADSIQDLRLLDHVGRPVAVAPDPPLRRIALKRGWEVLTDAA